MELFARLEEVEQQEGEAAAGEAASQAGKGKLRCVLYRAYDSLQRPGDAAPSQGKPPRHFLSVATFACIWLKDHLEVLAERKNLPDPNIDLCGSLGCGNKQMERELRAAGFPESVGTFLRRLETEPLPSPYRECGRRYAQEELNWPRHIPLPRCLDEDLAEE